MQIGGGFALKNRHSFANLAVLLIDAQSRNEAKLLRNWGQGWEIRHDMSNTVISKRTKLHRVSAEDFVFSEETLKTAALLIVPDDLTQRASFAKLMPHLYVLRNKGCSWAQLTTLINKTGFKLQPSTVRSYYSEMLLKSMDLCQARMNVQLDQLKKLREENAQLAGGADQLAVMAQRVNSQMQKVQQSTSARINEMFGLGALDPLPTAQPVLPSPAAPIQAPASPAAPNPRPAVAQTHKEPEDHNPQPPAASEFGLLNLGPAQNSADRPAGFFSMNDESSTPASATPGAGTRASAAAQATPAPTQPSQTKASSSEPTGHTVDPTSQERPVNAITVTRKCAPLNMSITPMKKRDNVPKEVYEPGQMEHPAIAGLMLSMEERMYGAALEYCDVNGDEAGVYRTETADEKRFRVTWRKVVPMTLTRTADTFMKMDKSLFKK